MVGLGLTFEDLPETRSALVGHWFEPYFERLRDVCAHIFSEYGKWQDRSAFEALGDLADEVVADGGLIVCGDLGDGRFQVRIPFTPATMPEREYGAALHYAPINDLGKTPSTSSRSHALTFHGR
jgi:hypothetical protein